MTDQTSQIDDRPTGQAILRGFQCKCPNCGSGPLLKGYLTLRTSCTVCREDLSAARADDGPAYLTILVVGHILTPLLHVFFTTFRPEPLVMASLFGVLAVGLSLFLLPRLKGVVVAIQWARRMHGFGHSA